MIDLKFAFRSMIDHSGFDRSDRSFSRIVWPLLFTWSLVAIAGYQNGHGPGSPRSDPCLRCSVNKSLSGARTRTLARMLGQCKCKGAFTPTPETARGARADPARGLRSGSVCRNCVVLFTRCLSCASAAGTRRDRSQSDSSAGPAGIGSADWSVSIDQWPSAAKWGIHKWWNCARTRASVNTRPAQKTLLHSRADPLRVGVNAP